MTEESSVKMQRIYVSGIPNNTSEEDLKTFFEPLGATVDVYKSSEMGFKNPFAFVKLPKEKAKELLEAEHKIGEATLTLGKPKATKKFYLDTRLTKGSIAELSEEQVRAYFSQYGEVTRVNLVGNKGIGFVDLNDSDENEKIGEIPWKIHEIDGNKINVKEAVDRKNDTRKRKQRWGGSRQRKRTNW